MSAPLQGTVSAAQAIDRVRYSHDAMIDLIIANPGIKQNSIAAHFGYSVPWVSRIFNSDAFQARLAQRKEDLVDPSILLTIEEKLSAVAARSLDILQEKLEQSSNGDFALKTAELSIKALGYGARQQNVNVQQNFVVAMPTKAASEVEWASKHTGGGGLLQAGASSLEVVDVLEKNPDLARLAAGGAPA